MHYAEYKHDDPALVGEMVRTFQFGTVMANGDDGPQVAQAPITFRTGQRAAGALEFHLARANPISPSLTPGAPITVMVHGPGAAISPKWYTASFQGERPDRSRTAPTYNYLSLVARGRVLHMPDEALQAQIGDLVAANEPSDGWQLNELAPELWEGWRAAIRLYRIEVESFDLTAKLSPGDLPEDAPGVAAGLRSRGVQDDDAMARMIEGYDGTSAALIERLAAMRIPLRAETAAP